MKRLKMLLAAGALVGFATTASAATITITPDKASYLPGEQIVLTAVATSQAGDTGQVAFIDLLYSAALTDLVTAGVQSGPFTAFSGGLPFTTGVLFAIDGQGSVIDQINFAGSFPVDPGTVVTSTLTLLAVAPGTVTVTYSLDSQMFQDISMRGQVATSFSIVPEPGTLLLLGSGLVGLLVAGRRS